MTTKEYKQKLYEGKNVDKEYQTMDGLGDVYQMIADGKCVCFGFRASCPKHGTKTSIYSTSTSTSR